MIYSAADLASQSKAGAGAAGGASATTSVSSAILKGLRTTLRRAGVHVSRRDVVASLRAQLAFRQDVHRRTIDELQGWVSEAEPSWPEPSPRRSELLVELLGTETSEALYIVANLHACLALEGQVAEFGVAQGATSAVLAGELTDGHKELWLFDSFRGLPRPSPQDTFVDDIFQAVDEFARDHASAFSLSLPRSWAGHFALLRRL